MRPNLVAGLDIGSTKTCAVIAEVTGEVMAARGPLDDDTLGFAICGMKGAGASDTLAAPDVGVHGTSFSSS